MPKTGDKAFEAIDPFFEVVMEGVRGLVDGKHYEGAESATLVTLATPIQARLF
jgi:hypothetical protein